MDLTWFILEEEFVFVVVIWLAVLTFAPLEYANQFWLGGALWMFAATGAAITEHGPTSETAMMVAGQLGVYCLLAAIIFARDYTEPDSDLGAADCLISIAAFLGQLTNSKQRQPRRQHQQRPQQRRPQHRPPWQRGDQPQRPTNQHRQQHRQDRGQAQDDRDHTDDSAGDNTGIDDLVDNIDEFRR